MVRVCSFGLRMQGPWMATSSGRETYVGVARELREEPLPDAAVPGMVRFTGTRQVASAPPWRMTSMRGVRGGGGQESYHSPPNFPPGTVIRHTPGLFRFRPVTCLLIKPTDLLRVVGQCARGNADHTLIREPRAQPVKTSAHFCQ